MFTAWCIWKIGSGKWRSCELRSRTHTYANHNSPLAEKVGWPRVQFAGASAGQYPARSLIHGEVVERVSI